MSTHDEMHRQATKTVDRWLENLVGADPSVIAVESEGNRRFIRLAGEAKSVFTIWLLIGQRTLHHETFVMPAPIENHAEFYAHLLRRNHSLRGLAFTIGAEEGIFLEGRIPLDEIDAGDLDEIVGMHWDAIERCFDHAMRIGWRSMYRARRST